MPTSTSLKRNTDNEVIPQRWDPTITDWVEYDGTIYGKDSGGVLHPLRTNSDGELEIVPAEDESGNSKKLQVDDNNNLKVAQNGRNVSKEFLVDSQAIADTDRHSVLIEDFSDDCTLVAHSTLNENIQVGLAAETSDSHWFSYMNTDETAENRAAPPDQEIVIPNDTSRVVLSTFDTFSTIINSKVNFYFVYECTVTPTKGAFTLIAWR